MPNNFCFIVDGINVEGELPVEIIPGHWFRKATSEEVKRIKEELAMRRIPLIKYEYKAVPVIKEGIPKGSETHEPLPSNEWRYYVISFEGSNDKIQDIEHAASLLEHDINIGFTFLYSQMGPDGYGVMYNPFIVSTFFVDEFMPYRQVISIESNELLEITTNYDLITKLDKASYSNISRAVSDFYQTKMITNRSLLKVVSYFSIIECLITHYPSAIDSIESVTRQVKTKMSLLSKRFQRELDYSVYFGKATSENVWKKLYSYRSKVAHGMEVNFEGELKILVSRDNIQEFLKESVKLLLLYALTEPDFVTDLQRC